MGIFSPNYPNFFEEKRNSAVVRLRRNVNNFILRFGNYYVYRKMLEEPSEDADILTGEVDNLNNYKHHDYIIKASIKHYPKSDIMSMQIDPGYVDVDSLVLYIKYNEVIVPSVNDFIFEFRFPEGKFTLSDLFKNKPNKIFRVTHVIPYKIDGFVIYYATYVKVL